MEGEYQNICTIGRAKAGYTQEVWAEILGISVDTVRKYESGAILPSDQVALRIADAADLKLLAYWHLRNKSALGSSVLPAVRRRTLPEAVLCVMNRVEDFQRHGLQDLRELAEDGKIDADEVIAYGEAMDQLRQVIAAAYELEYAREAE